MKKQLLLVALLAATFIWSCKKDSIIKDDGGTPVVKVDSAILTSVKIEAKNNSGKISADIACSIGTNDTITAVLPAMKPVKKLAVTFVTKNTGTLVKVKDTLQISGTTVTDFSKPVPYTVTSSTGITKTYTVVFKAFTGLPILYITSASPIVSKDDYVKGSINIDANLSFSQDVTSLTMQVKGHGNSTWSLAEFVKKSYRIKLDSKTALLGMSAAKNWVLLANYDDKTLMRNRIALQLGRRLGSDWAYDSRFVEVVLNGDFVGNYQLLPQVEVNPGRVNITELTATNTSDADITGGYLLEVDYRKDADFWFVTKKNLPFTIKSPDAITPKQLDYIHNYVQTTEDVLFSDSFADPVNGYAKYINPDSFINWYFAEEIMQNQDGRDFSSIFYYKDRNGKLGMGPLWDFDLSSGSADSTIAQYPTGYWYIRDATWMLRLAQDPTFILKVRKRWADIKNDQVKKMFTDIDQTAEYLKLSQQQNFVRWPILSTKIYRNQVALGSYDKEVAYFKDFLTQRVNWIDGNMGAW